MTFHSSSKSEFRSGLEERIDAELTEQGIPHEFETLRLEFSQPAKVRHYTPDFTIQPKTKAPFILETKGRFTSEDRQKMKMVKECHPEKDIRMLFSNANARINKRSKTTYADWCQKYGFQWAHKVIPSDWLS